MIENICVVNKGKVRQFEVGVNGIFAYDNIMYIRSGSFEKRANSVKDVIGYFKENYIDRNKSYSISNHNLLDKEWSHLEQSINRYEKKRDNK